MVLLSCCFPFERHQRRNRTENGTKLFLAAAGRGHGRRLGVRFGSLAVSRFSQFGPKCQMHRFMGENSTRGVTVSIRVKSATVLLLLCSEWFPSASGNRFRAAADLRFSYGPYWENGTTLAIAPHDTVSGTHWFGSHRGAPATRASLPSAHLRMAFLSITALGSLSILPT